MSLSKILILRKLRSGYFEGRTGVDPTRRPLQTLETERWPGSHRSVSITGF